MTTVIILTKAYNNSQVKQIENTLKSLLEGLNVETKILSPATNEWVQVAIQGEDENIAVNYVTKKIGTCPSSMESVEKFSTLKGYITNPNQSKEKLLVDIGISKPNTIFANIPLSHLQAQLVDGRKTSLEKITDLFALCDNLPINVKITRIDSKESLMEAEFSASQIRKYEAWQESLLDRLLVIGASEHEIERTLRYTGLDRDVISVETLGMFEHSLTCKLGTDATGLIWKIGKMLKNSKLSVFRPRRIDEFIEQPQTQPTTNTNN